MQSAFGRRRLLQGLAALFALGRSPSAAQDQAAAPSRSAPKTEGLAYGWDPLIRGPDRASYHVAPTGRAGAIGSAEDPFGRISEGVAALARHPEGSLALHGGTYREAVNLDALRGRSRADGRAAYLIHRRGDDLVRISAADPWRGWTRVSPEEATGFGLGDQPLYRSALPLAEIRHGAPAALNLHERGIWCPLASLSGPTAAPPHLFDHREFRPARFESDAQTGFVTAILDPGLRGLAAGLLQDTQLILFEKGNRIGRTTIGGFDPATGRLLLAPGSKIRAPDPARQAYRILNFAPATLRGGWFFRRRGAQIDLYLVPRAPEQIESSIEVSLRDHCVDFAGASSVELFGLETLRAAGQGREAGCCIRRHQPNQPASRDLRLSHCRAGETVTSLGGGFGAIYLRDVEGVQIRHCSIEACRAGFGLFLSNCREADLRHLYFFDISFSPARFYGLVGGIFAFSLLRRCGSDTHANKLNFYLGSDRVLVYGVKAEDTGGYATYQSASRIHFAFCDFDGTPGASGRILVAQNFPPGAKKGGPDGSGDPVPGSRFWFWNLTLLPAHAEKQAANALSLGPEASTHRHEIHNCLLNGGGFAPIYTKGAPPARENRTFNRYTGRAWWQGMKHRWALGQGEADQRSGDPPGGTGRDLSADIARDIATLFPGFTDWDLDVDGRRFDWRAPPIGARAP